MFKSERILKRILLLSFSGEWKEFQISLQGKTENVRWKFIEDLHNLQDKEGFLLANKLNTNHVQWQMHKMNVKYAAQTMSESVANAIEFLREDLKSPDFKESEGTVKFIRSVDRAFDILNSRTPRASGYKSPLRSNNIGMCEKSLRETADMLLGATTGKGHKIINSRRKTGFICFAASIKSILAISRGLLQRPINPLKYVLTYRFSQDHLEVFFSCVRGRYGWNNNPDSLQFRSSLQSMLFKNAVKGSLNANCVQFDQTAQTPLFTIKWSKRIAPVIHQLNSDDTEALNLHESIIRKSVYKENVLYYIAGFITRRMLSTITCSVCATAIQRQNVQALTEHNYHSIIAADYCKLTERKNNGGLKFASFGIFKIVQMCEKLFQAFVLDNAKKITADHGICQRIILKCVQEVSSSLDSYFPMLSNHGLTEDPGCEDSHTMQLVKETAKQYAKLRLQTYAKFYNRVIVNKRQASIRHKMTKTVLFKNQ